MSAVLAQMISITSEIAKIEVREPTKLWDIASKVKRERNIPRGEQTYYYKGNKVSKSTMIKGPMEFTLVRSQLVCGACGNAQMSEKFKACGNCLDVYYCTEICQKHDWKCHKAECQKTIKKRTAETTHEHQYKKRCVSGPRDNNEYDYVCDCGHIA